MGDVVVTVPKNFEYYDPKSKRLLGGIEGWIAEGDAAGEPWSGEEWYFTLGGYPPRIAKGERVYIVHNNKLRGYAPLIRVERLDYGYALVRGGGAVAITIDETIVGFRGFKYRWWGYEQEKPFPDWQQP